MEEFITIQKNVGHAPRKVRLVADMVRKLTPQQALQVLQFTNKAAAIDLAKAIKTALANAGGHSDHVGFAKIEINEGLKIKRYRVGTAGRGRGRPYKKRLSHIKIVLTEVKSSEPGKTEKVTSNQPPVTSQKAKKGAVVKSS